MKKTNSGFSIVIALFLVLAMVLTAQYILSYIIPFSKHTKGIENSVKAYYEASKAAETAIYQIKNKDIVLNDTPTINIGAGNVENVFHIDGNSNIIPPAGEGNSDFDKDFNKLSLSEPIQLVLKNNTFNLAAISLQIKIPDVVTEDPMDAGVNPDESIDLNLTLNGEPLYYDSTGTEITDKNDIPIVGWSLSSPTNTIIGTQYITLGQINSGTLNLPINNLNGEDLNEQPKTLNNFYTDTSSSGAGICGNTTDTKCVLKFSLINNLKLDADEEPVYPYLEYKLDLGGASNELLTKNARITAEGKSYGFKRDIELDIPQKSTASAFDFTIMQ